MSAIVVSDLTVERAGRGVLRDVSISVAPGSVVGLLGPSGSGKTTLMRAIAGVQQTSSGTVTVLGESAGSVPLRGRIGYMTQQASVYSDLTVVENVAYFARILGVESDVDRVIDVVEMSGYRNTRVDRLSGGERARVCLATALVGSPPVLILDEPTVGLDPVLRQQLWGIFHELAAAGTALLVSSHVMDEAERCDYLVLLRDGRVLASGTQQELLAVSGATSVEGAFLELVRNQP
jgi:ABC-2 type transport system ATP-binding protein